MSRNEICWRTRQRPMARSHPPPSLFFGHGSTRGASLEITLYFFDRAHGYPIHPYTKQRIPSD